MFLVVIGHFAGLRTVPTITLTVVISHCLFSRLLLPPFQGVGVWLELVTASHTEHPMCQTSIL